MARPNKRQRANAKRMHDYRDATTLPRDIEQEARVPLAGFESLYEITRSGHLFSVRAKRFIKRAHLEQPYLRVRVDGVSHNLNIQESVAASWAEAKAHLYRVEIPATVMVVLARDVNEAREVAARGVSEEIKDRRIPVVSSAITTVSEVPNEWLDGMPYAPDGMDDQQVTVQELVTGIAPVSAAPGPRVNLIARLNRETKRKK